MLKKFLFLCVICLSANAMKKRFTDRSYVDVVKNFCQSGQNSHNMLPLIKALLPEEYQENISSRLYECFMERLQEWLPNDHNWTGGQLKKNSTFAFPANLCTNEALAIPKEINEDLSSYIEKKSYFDYFFNLCEQKTSNYQVSFQKNYKSLFEELKKKRESIVSAIKGVYAVDPFAIYFMAWILDPKTSAHINSLDKGTYWSLISQAYNMVRGWSSICSVFQIMAVIMRGAQPTDCFFSRYLLTFSPGIKPSHRSSDYCEFQKNVNSYFICCILNEMPLTYQRELLDYINTSKTHESIVSFSTLVGCALNDWCTELIRHNPVQVLSNLCGNLAAYYKEDKGYNLRCGAIQYYELLTHFKKLFKKMDFFENLEIQVYGKNNNDAGTQWFWDKINNAPSSSIVHQSDENLIENLDFSKEIMKTTEKDAAEILRVFLYACHFASIHYPGQSEWKVDLKLTDLKQVLNKIPYDNIRDLSIPIIKQFVYMFASASGFPRLLEQTLSPFKSFQDDNFYAQVTEFYSQNFDPNNESVLTLHAPPEELVPASPPPSPVLSAAEMGKMLNDLEDVLSDIKSDKTAEAGGEGKVQKVLAKVESIYKVLKQQYSTPQEQQ